MYIFISAIYEEKHGFDDNINKYLVTILELPLSRDFYTYNMIHFDIVKLSKQERFKY